MTMTTTGRWSMLAVLLLGQFMGLLDVFVVNVAMPVIGTDLHASGASLQLVVGGYTVAYAMLLITGARLGDLYGRRRMYLLGVIGFTVTSLACGFAPGPVALVVFRFLQGAAAAVMVPQIMSVIQMQFTGAARAKALSAYGVVLSTGAVVGLVLGGVVVSADLFGASWRPVFLINVPFGVLLAFLVPRLVPADEPRATRRLDFGGLAIATSAVCLFVLPLVLGREMDWPVWAFVCIAAGVLLAGVFVSYERRAADPLLSLEVLRAPGLAAGLLTLLCMQVTYGGFLFVFTLHLQTVEGEGALATGLTYLPMAVTFGIAGMYWRKLPEKTHRALPSIGLAMCTLAYLSASGAPHLVALSLAGAGMGLSVSPLLTQSLVHVPMSQAPDASGLFTTAMQLGQVVGVATFGTLFLSLASPALAKTGYWLALVAVVGLIYSFRLRSAYGSAAPENC